MLSLSSHFCVVFMCYAAQILSGKVLKYLLEFLQILPVLINQSDLKFLLQVICAIIFSINTWHVDYSYLQYFMT